VVLNVNDGDALLAAIRTIKKNTKVDRVLVQPMTTGLGEVLIGYRVDADVGPTIMLAAGGILAEIHRDRALRLAPIDLDDAREMIAEVKALKALAGYRGKPRGDLDALARALVALSQLAVSAGPAVAEAEVNPLMVRPDGQGVVAVDALVKLA
jgi:acyl-CoA synthetase (NDP forming)